MGLPHISRSGSLYRSLRRVRSVVIIAGKRLSAVHTTSYVHPTAKVERDLVADAYVFVGHHCEIGAQVRIGRYTMLAPHVTVVGDDHIFGVPGTPLQFTGRPTQTETVIEEDVWLGHGALVMRGVRIGRGAIVAARAVVTRDIPPYTVVAGVPARHVRHRFASPDDVRLHDAMLASPTLPPTFVEPVRFLQSGPCAMAPLASLTPKGGGYDQSGSALVKGPWRP